MANPQVKSKKRVENHGEVFTAEREVNAMLDLVKPETERIDSRFLEPACGNGNFLSEVLRRKISIVAQRYGRNQTEFERYLFLAVSSIYGIDLLEDNVQECRDRLYTLAMKSYTIRFEKSMNSDFSKALSSVLQKNIVCGDALTLTDKEKKAIVFPEWSFVNGNKIKRRDYTFDSLLNSSTEQPTFETQENLDPDPNCKGMAIPTPIREYPLMDFLRIGDYE